MKAIRDLMVSERPREKLDSYGASALRDEELLAIILGSGSKSAGVHTLAKRVLAVINQHNGDLRLSALMAVPGMGRAKSTLILAAVEFARRRIRPRGVRISQAKDIVPLVSHWARAAQEHFITITLNGAHEVIETRVVTVGLVNSSQIHPREVFAAAITDRACAIIAAHNHPSGNLIPSDADKKVTKTLAEAGKLLGITLLDHVIFSEGGIYSFQESGLL